MRVAYSILGFCDRFLQIVVPVRRRRICYVSFPDYTGNTYYMYRHALETRNHLEHVWLVDSLEIGEDILREFYSNVARVGTVGHTLKVYLRKSLKGYFQYLRSRVTFHTHGAYPFSVWSVRRVIVSLWHGMPIKCIGRLNTISPNPTPTYGTLHLATSPMYQAIMAKAFGVTTEKVRISGLPRCDALRFDSPLKTSAEVVRHKLSIAEARRFVMWMPTYRTEQGAPDRSRNARTFLDDLPNGAMDLLNRAAARSDCSVVLKLHPYDPLNQHHASINGKYSHIRLISAQDWSGIGLPLYDVLAVADGLISDVSSILIDYLVTDKPMAIVGFNPDTYTRELVLPLETITSSQRFIHLDSETAMERFFTMVATGERMECPGDDPAHALYSVSGERAAESVLLEVGY